MKYDGFYEIFIFLYTLLEKIIVICGLIYDIYES